MPIIKEVCFWCRKPKGMGYTQITNNTNHPALFLRNYDMCPDCEAKYGEHILIFEAIDKPRIEGQRKHGTGYPTGKFLVVAMSDLEEVKEFLELSDEDTQIVKQHHRIAVPPEIYQHILDVHKKESQS